MITNKPKKGKKERFARTKKWAKNIILGVAALHGATQLAYWGNDAINAVAPSKQRVEFKEEFGFPIKGPKEHIEKETKNMSLVSRVIQREKAEKEFELSSLRINTNNYLKENILEQASMIFNTPYAGVYNTAINSITLKEKVDENALHHEIKHAKTYEIIKDHPEFLEEWKALAKDDSGKSLYLTNVEFFASRLKGLGFIVSSEKKNSEKNEELGFVSDYARTNVYEDIAELGAEAETFSEQFTKWLSKDSETRNEIIAKKVALAQKYGIIAPGFTEYIQLKDKLLDSYVEGYININQAQPFMEESAEFLEKFPHTIYQGEIRSTRAYVISQGTYGFHPKHTLDEAIEEYKKVFDCEFKDGTAYSGALNKLSELSLRAGNEKNARIYKDAENECYKRFDNGDVKFYTEGINHILEEKGVLN